MTTARTVSLGLGIIFLLGVGVVTVSRAQQAGDKAKPSIPTRTEIQERVLKLRTEIEVLQVEYDAARVNFSKAMEMMGISEDVVFDSIAAGAFQLGTKRDEKETSEIVERIRSTGADGLKGVDTTALVKAIRGIASGEKEAAKDLLRSLKDWQNPMAPMVQLKRSRFAELSTELNRKKLNLAEAEKLYQTEAH